MNIFVILGSARAKKCEKPSKKDLKIIIKIFIFLNLKSYSLHKKLRISTNFRDQLGEYSQNLKLETQSFEFSSTNGFKNSKLLKPLILKTKSN
jgi:hypothetical protein